MGKDKNAAQSAAKEAAAKQEAPATEKVEVVQVGDLLKKGENVHNVGLSPDATVMALNGLKSMVHDNPNAAEYYNMSEDAVKQLNHFTLAGFATVLAIEVMNKKSEFAVRMLAKQPEAINAIAEYTGVSIDTKYLPAPKSDGTVEVPSSAVSITNEAKKGLKEEVEIANRVVILDPTKIENDQQLKDSLLQLLVKGNGSDNFYDKVVSAINFYESYLAIQANKSDDKDNLLASLKKKSKGDLLNEISNLLGKCTFTMRGMAKFMYEQTERTKSPVTAFCIFRNASLNKKTGMPQIDDVLVADIVRVLVHWYADTEKEISKGVLENFKKDLAVLSKDEKKNAKAIEQGKQKIKNVEAHIAAVEQAVNYTHIPDRSVIDSFKSNFLDPSSEGYKMARMMGSKIIDSYYPGIKVKEYDQEILSSNLQQYMGTISNMFLPPMDQIPDYSEKNIVELKKLEVEEPTEEAEEKNS